MPDKKKIMIIEDQALLENTKKIKNIFPKEKLPHILTES